MLAKSLGFPISTSPAVPSILAKSLVPRFALFGGCNQWFGIRGYGERVLEEKLAIPRVLEA
jgi:hypothetical protein